MAIDMETDLDNHESRRSIYVKVGIKDFVITCDYGGDTWQSTCKETQIIINEGKEFMWKCGWEICNYMYLCRGYMVIDMQTALDNHISRKSNDV